MTFNDILHDKPNAADYMTLEDRFEQYASQPIFYLTVDCYTNDFWLLVTSLYSAILYNFVFMCGFAWYWNAV